MENAYRNNWFEDLARSIESNHSGQIAFLGMISSDVRELIEQTWRYFSQHRIKRRSDMMQLCVIGLAVGGRFYEDPRFPVLVDFSTRQMPSARRIAYLRSEVGELSESLWPSGQITSRLEEMIAALQQGDGDLITNLAFLGKEPWNYDTENLPATGYSHTIGLQPLIKMLGPKAMVDPTHAAFQRIVQNAGSIADVRKAAIKEMRRRMDIVKE